MLVRSPTSDSILYASRRVRPVLVKTIPKTSEPKMNQTDGSMKSVNATRAGRIRKSAWTTPMAMLVTPIGITSVTHQVAARKKSASAAFPSRVRGKAWPCGSRAGSGGREVHHREEDQTEGEEADLFQSRLTSSTFRAPSRRPLRGRGAVSGGCHPLGQASSVMATATHERPPGGVRLFHQLGQFTKRFDRPHDAHELPFRSTGMRLTSRATIA